MKKTVLAVVFGMVSVAAFAKSVKVAGTTTEFKTMMVASKETKVQKVPFFDSYIYFEEGSKESKTVNNIKYKFKYDEVKESKREKASAKFAKELAEIVADNAKYEEQRDRLSNNQVSSRSLFSDINHRGFYTDSLKTIQFTEDFIMDFANPEEIEELAKANYKIWTDITEHTTFINSGIDTESKKKGITIYWDSEVEQFYVVNYLEVED